MISRSVLSKIKPDTKVIMTGFSQPLLKQGKEPSMNWIQILKTKGRRILKGWECYKKGIEGLSAGGREQCLWKVRPSLWQRWPSFAQQDGKWSMRYSSVFVFIQTWKLNVILTSLLTHPFFLVFHLPASFFSGVVPWVSPFTELDDALLETLLWRRALFWSSRVCSHVCS